MTMEQLDELYKILESKQMYVDIVRDYDLPRVIGVQVTWGDWKHDHLRLDMIMEELGYTHITTNVTEEDGSDAYSAIHYYEVPNEE